MKNLRRAAFVAFLILFAAIVFRLVTARPGDPGSGEIPLPHEGGRLERKIGARHSEFSGGRESFRTRADSVYAGEDGLQHLEGNVEIIDFGRTGGRNIVISAGHVALDEDRTRFDLLENVSVREKDIVIEAPGFKYDRIQEAFHTVLGAAFATGKLKGTSRSLRYAIGSGELELEGDLRLESRPEASRDIPLIITGDRLFYHRDSGTGEVTGAPVLERGGSRAEGGRLMFILSSDRENLETAVFENGVKAVFQGPDFGDGAYRIEADEARTVLYPETLVSTHFEAKGNSRLVIAAPDGGVTRLDSDYSILYFTPEGELKDLAAWPNVRITIDAAGDSGEPRRFSAARVDYNHQHGALVLKKGPGRRPRADSGGLDIEADQIVIHMRTENVEASGEVRLIMRSGESGTPVGFFSGGKPVFITCGRMSTRADDRRFFFRDQVRIWQERESVSASELDILQETGRVVFRGGVHSLLFRKTGDDDDEEERLEMRSDEMVFIPERNLIRYTGSGRLETQSFTLRADSLAVTLAGTGGAMDRVEAEGNVVIDQEARQGRGERAVYERAAATVVLTGHPVLAERDKGETKGDKLTFYLDDGRIAIENIKRDRSTTVIIR